MGSMEKEDMEEGEREDKEETRKERGGGSQTAPRRMQPRELREAAEVSMGRAHPPQARKLPS